MSRFVPTLEQREILEHQGPLLVLAGAGVGKTAVLIQRIANAIEQDGVPPEQILGADLHPGGGAGDATAHRGGAD